MPIVFVMQGKCLFSDISSPVAFQNSGNRLALGHMSDMRCLEKSMFDLILYIPSTIFQI